MGNKQIMSQYLADLNLAQSIVIPIDWLQVATFSFAIRKTCEREMMDALLRTCLGDHRLL